MAEANLWPVSEHAVYGHVYRFRVIASDAWWDPHARPSDISFRCADVLQMWFRNSDILNDQRWLRRLAARKPPSTVRWYVRLRIAILRAHIFAFHVQSPKTGECCARLGASWWWWVSHFSFSPSMSNPSQHAHQDTRALGRRVEYDAYSPLRQFWRRTRTRRSLDGAVVTNRRVLCWAEGTWRCCWHWWFVARTRSAFRTPAAESNYNITYEIFVRYM